MVNVIWTQVAIEDFKINPRVYIKGFGILCGSFCWENN